MLERLGKRKRASGDGGREFPFSPFGFLLTQGHRLMAPIPE
jgi:hypothetical protein